MTSHCTSGGIALPRFVISELLTGKLRRPFDWSAAHYAGVPLRIGLSSACRAIKHLDAHFPIHTAISAIDLENLLLKIVFCQVRAFSQQLPHCLTRQRKALHMPL